MGPGLERSGSPGSIECDFYPAVLLLPFSMVRRKR